MRNISFALTTAQFLDGSKDVTRRLGWENLKPGTLLMACRKCMGLKPGESLERLGVIEVVSVRREPLHDIGTYAADCRREGFPEMEPEEFVTMFCKHMKCRPETIVTRIEFKRILELPEVLLRIFSVMAACPAYADYSSAWAIQRDRGDRLSHQPRCSFGAGLLCDCGAVADEWKRLRGMMEGKAA